MIHGHVFLAEECFNVVHVVLIEVQVRILAFVRTSECKISSGKYCRILCIFIVISNVLLTSTMCPMSSHSEKAIVNMPVGSGLCIQMTCT